MRFTKMHGIGNDYIYINGFEQTVSDPSALAVQMSDRHTGVGADGLILILPSANADARMQMFNADGSEGEMCGNGIRCLAKYIHERNISSNNPMQVETAAGILTLELQCEGPSVTSVRVDMGEPILKASAIPVCLPEHNERPIIDHPLDVIELGVPSDWMRACELQPGMTCVSMGNPHLMLYCGNLENVPLATIGPLIERAPIFPSRINVHFVQNISSVEVSMRTWERGSGITLACGTGASAVCVAGVLTERTGPAITAHLPGGDLKLEWDRDLNHVFMTGPATEVFSGEWPSRSENP